MRNASRHGGRYTEPRKSLEKGSLRIGRDSDGTDWNKELGLIPWLNGEGRQSAYRGEVWCEKNLD
jgi:hypothetical protein